MPGPNYLKQQGVAEKFLDFAYSYQDDNKPASKRALEKLAALESLQLQNDALSRSRVCSGLTILLRYARETDTAVIEKATELLIKYAQDAERIYLCNDWAHDHPPSRAIDALVEAEKWLVPYQRGSYHFAGFHIALKFDYTEWLEKFLADFELDADENCSLLVNALHMHRYRNPEAVLVAKRLVECIPAHRKQQVLAGYASLVYGYDKEPLQYLVEQDFYPPANLEVVITLALVRGTFFDKVEESSEVVNILLDLLKCSHHLAREIETVLRNLRTKEAQSTLCESFIEWGYYSKQIETLLVECSYEPLNPAQKVLFFFLTRQFARYDVLDFDHSILRGLYEAADPHMRGRIAEAVKQSGNPAYIEILSLKQASFAVEISNTQSQVMLQVLQDRKEWAVLWQKVRELPFDASVSALKRLLKSNWRPTDPEENQLYQKLANLFRAKIAKSIQLNIALPVTLRLASFQTSRKLHSFVFTPDSQRLVLASSSRKLIFRDFLQGYEEKTLTGLNYGASHLGFTTDGTLFCAEQPSDQNCSSSVYSWSSLEAGATPCKLDEQIGTVKLIEPLPGNHLLVVREGQSPQVLNADTRQVKTTLDLSDEKIWDALVMPEYNAFILAGEYFYIFDLDSFSQLGKIDTYGSHHCESLVYVPALKRVMVGDRYSRVNERWTTVEHFTTWWYSTDFYSFRDKNPKTSNRSTKYKVYALADLSQQDLVVAGAEGGRIAFSSYVRKDWSRVFHVPGQTFDSLQISPDGQLMAVAENSTTLSLWDLRPLEIHKLLEQPLLHATTRHLVALRLLEKAEHSADLALPVKNALAYMREILDYRFRYDIDIEVAPEIAPGNFDIEL